MGWQRSSAVGATEYPHRSTRSVVLVRLGSLPQLRRRLQEKLVDDSRPRSSARAIVFAPHQDDETLGCGGTIILKRQAGTPVTLVFMTDGTTSHRRFMDAEELRLLRREEALAAADVLGIAPTEVHFLDFADGELGNFHDAAVRRVVELVNDHRPAEVFVPYRADGTPDHEATYRVVTEALSQMNLPVRICEYPVWFWNQWPWVPLQLGCNRDTLKSLRQILRGGFGMKTYRTFRSGVFVGDVLDRKRRALAQHRSQMTKLRPGVAWPILSEISGGGFLQCFFQEYEVFHCSHFVPAGGTDIGARNRALHCVSGGG